MNLSSREISWVCGVPAARKIREKKIKHFLNMVQKVSHILPNSSDLEDHSTPKRPAPEILANESIYILKKQIPKKTLTSFVPWFFQPWKIFGKSLWCRGWFMNVSGRRIVFQKATFQKATTAEIWFYFCFVNICKRRRVFWNNSVSYNFQSLYTLLVVRVLQKI